VGFELEEALFQRRVMHRRICEKSKVILKVVMMLRAETYGMEKRYWGGGGGGGGFLTEVSSLQEAEKQRKAGKDVFEGERCRENDGCSRGE